MSLAPSGPDNRAFWQGRWQAGQTGWDLGGPHPALASLIEEARDYGLIPESPAGVRVLEPGCGRAHNGAALAAAGFTVTALDAVDEAIAAARELYGERPGLTLEVGDALAVRDEWRGRFDVVFDRAMLCAIAPAQRRAYVQACFAHLRPGGVLLSLPFIETSLGEGRSGPPFAIPMPELARLTAGGFALVTAEERRVDDGRIVRELAAVWRRRERWLVESD
jgi:SAM-dependent methyltransferase